MSASFAWDAKRKADRAGGYGEGWAVGREVFFQEEVVWHQVPFNSDSNLLLSLLAPCYTAPTHKHIYTLYLYSVTKRLLIIANGRETTSHGWTHSVHN